MKQRQQKELADSVIAKVEKELSNPKVLQQILDQSVKDVESMSISIHEITLMLITMQDSFPRRHRRFREGEVDWAIVQLQLCLYSSKKSPAFFCPI